ncbi:hypothetical protein D3C80_1808420 [compost metagenome]
MLLICVVDSHQFTLTAIRFDTVGWIIGKHAIYQLLFLHISHRFYEASFGAIYHKSGQGIGHSKAPR